MLSRKFNAAVAAGVLSLGLLAGCSPTPSQLQAYAAHPEQCVVVDLQPQAYQLGNSPVTYNFKMGAVTFSAYNDFSSHKVSGRDTQYSHTMAMKDLAEDGQARAQEMFSKLPPSANCKAPKFGG